MLVCSVHSVCWFGYRWCKYWNMQLLEWLQRLRRLHLHLILSYHPFLASVVALFQPLHEHHDTDCSYDVNDNITAINPITCFTHID